MPGHAFLHRIPTFDELLGAEDPGAVVAPHQIVILGVPVFEGRDVKTTANAVKLIFLGP